jgi:hypothetical protein
VLKTGGDFGTDYVIALYNACKRNITFADFCFTCLTDDPELLNADLKGINAVFLVVGWKGWWSKFSVFTVKGATIYFDLDTVIVGNIDKYVEEVMELKENEFIGVKAFNPMRNRVERTMFNSGVMGWNGDHGYVLENFDYKRDSEDKKYCGDQDRISEILRENYIDIKYWQDLTLGLHSYKRHIKTNDNRLIRGSKIICFHGQPRPRDMELTWVKENWKCEKVEI